MATLSPPKLNKYEVELYNGVHLLQSQTVEARTKEEASIIARGGLFQNIKVKVKKHYT